MRGCASVDAAIQRASHRGQLPRFIRRKYRTIETHSGARSATMRDGTVASDGIRRALRRKRIYSTIIQIGKTSESQYVRAALSRRKNPSAKLRSTNQRGKIPAPPRDIRGCKDEHCSHSNREDKHE